MQQLGKTQHKPYRFLPQDFIAKQWATIQPYYKKLLERELPFPEALKQWFLDRNELEGALSEELGWRYINATRDTTNQAYRSQYEAYMKEILPRLIPLTHQLNEKVVQCPHTPMLKQEAGFDIVLRCIEKSVQIYRTENIPLLTALKLKSQHYSRITGVMSLAIESKELTLQQAEVHLEEPNRALRENVYEQINQRWLRDQEMLDDLYTQLIKDRHQVATNAGFKNFRDYAFVAMNRFDYTPQDCFAFHEAVATEVVPLLEELAKQRKDLLKVHSLKPWDKQVDPTQKSPLRPFKHTGDLLQKTITVFDRLDPFLGNFLRSMEQMGHFDLESRKGKAPGGYNYPLEETGVPFIFMNATATLSDVVTLLHEGGHAVHSFLVKDLELNDFKHAPSELAELASMSMELLTMDHWDVFFAQEKDLKRAKRQHLEKILSLLAWIATIDAFQHWIYENPEHTPMQRQGAWIGIFDRFADSITDWTGQEDYKSFLWQRQLHLFELPFYYIEYGIAQLGAIAIWKNYQDNPTQGLKRYLAALKLGYTRSIPQVYETAGINFDFSKTYIRKLVQFLQKKLEEVI